MLTHTSSSFVAFIAKWPTTDVCTAAKVFADLLKHHQRQLVKLLLIVGIDYDVQQKSHDLLKHHLHHLVEQLSIKYVVDGLPKTSPPSCF